ncbi:MAG: DUF2069 domain-containing protein [Dokdonella sp.]
MTTEPNAERAGFIAWAALVLLQPAWYLWLAPPENGNGLLAVALTLIPLLLPLFALARSRQRALLWIGIVSLVYFCHGIVAAYAVPEARLPALIEALLCTLLIASLGWQVRSARAQKS